MSEKDEVQKWLNKIAIAEKAYNEYHEQIKKVREYYKNEKSKNKTNIFWSSVETLKPFLYFKQPVPYVERKDKTSDKVQYLACKMLEKAIEWDLSQFDFDSVMKYVRNDFLISGMGIAYEKYNATFKKIVTQQVSENGVIEVVADVKDSERVETCYIDPVDFIADSEKVGIWEDCTWFGRVIHMTNEELIAQFGKKFNYLVDDENDRKKDTKVYEIWDKKARKTYYIGKDCGSEFLKVTDDILKIDGFFPLPKPLYATLTNDSLIPASDYKEIKPLLDELDGIVERMRLTGQALKVSGCYDNSFPELANILDKDVTLVSISDFTKLKENGGLAGIMDFAPIAQYITALQALAERRQDLVAQIYEITGVSDIMRGNSDPNETATAVTKKTNFGTLRNQDRQNDMQRFIIDLLKIKADIICEMFEPETLAQFLSEEDKQDGQAVMQAINLLKTDKMRNMYLGIETDTSFNQDAEAVKTQEAIKTINDMITNAFGIVSQQPLLLPLYRKMTESLVAQLPNARQFEPVIDDVFNKIGEQLAQPQPEQPNAEIMKVQQNQDKINKDFAIKQEQNKIKQEELALKKQTEDNKIMMQNKEADMQFELKQQEIAAGQNTSANISTGYVRGF